MSRDRTQRFLGTGVRKSDGQHSEAAVSVRCSPFHVHTLIVKVMGYERAKEWFQILATA